MSWYNHYKTKQPNSVHILWDILQSRDEKAAGASYWISNYIHIKVLCVITHPRLNFSAGSPKLPPMKLGHGLVITCHRNLWILLLIHVVKRLDREDIGGHDVSRNKCGSKVKINVLVLRNWCLLFFQYIKKCIAHYGFTIIRSLQSGVTMFSVRFRRRCRDDFSLSR